MRLCSQSQHDFHKGHFLGVANARLVARLFTISVVFVLLAGCSSNRTNPTEANRTEKQSTASATVNTNATAPTGRSLFDLKSVSRSETQAGTIAMRANASQDDWATEQQTELAQAQFEALATLVMEGRLDDSELAAILAADIECRFPSVDSFGTAYEDQQFQIHRVNDGGSVGVTTDHEAGYQGFRKLAASWTRQAATAGRLELKFKLFHIEPTAIGFTTRSFLEVTTHGDPQSSQIDLECRCEWAGSDNNTRMTSFVVVKCSVSHVSAPHGQLFVDSTRSVMGQTAAYDQQVVPGISYWTRRIGRELMGQFGHHGLAIGDVNGDGLDDLYVCDAGGLPNRLYLQEADGTVTDASRTSGLDLLDESLGALLVDLDNDGDQDLVVVCGSFVQFAENDGAGQFTLREQMMVETDAYSLAAADFDQDGDLDIYVCGYNARRQDATNRGLPFPLPYHDANNGGRNYLLRNDGAFSFSDVTEAVGLHVDNRRFSLAAAWEDYNNDGDQDLYVANDFGRNCLYRNDGGSFVNVAQIAGVEDHASGMSVSWGDYDRDGYMDIYVSNMFSAAGNRVTFQRRFAEGIADDTLANIQRMARGNTLFRNRGDGTFEDVSVVADVTQGRWAWGSRFADVNNDGWQDLVVANGYMTNEDTSDL